MSFQYIRPLFWEWILMLGFVYLPLAGNGHSGIETDLNRTKVMLRTIGHEILLCSGDVESLVLPIQQEGKAYKISFGAEFGFDPEDLIQTIKRVVESSGLATDYVVEVEHCKTKQVVHSFMVEATRNTVLLPCKGRVLPKACYQILITFLDTTPQTPENQFASFWSTINNYSWKVALLGIGLFALLGFFSIYRAKTPPIEQDTNLVKFGLSSFDKQRQTLTVNQERIELSHKEAELLSLLIDHINEPIERAYPLNPPHLS